MNEKTESAIETYAGTSWLIAWNSRHPDKPNEVLVGPYPGTGATRHLVFSDGPFKFGLDEYRALSKGQKREYLLRMFVMLTVDYRLPAADVHRELLKVKEYRGTLAGTSI